MSALFKHKKTGGVYTIVATPVALLAKGDRFVEPESIYVYLRAGSTWVAARDYPKHNVTVYVANVQAAQPIEIGTECVLYRGTDGANWLRARAEFVDGRFEPITVQAAAMMPSAWFFGELGKAAA